ncbi:MAG: hypothetical protein ACRD4X_04180 [Candidatus Acidiferrales bacterium]
MPQQAPPSRPRSATSERSTRQVSYHARKCSICRHPQRSEIEQAFLDWQCISSIATEFQLRGRNALYRHARAVGLLADRNRAVRGALARIIEKVCDVEPDAAAIVRAIEIFAHINDQGEWIAPPPRSARTEESPVEHAGGRSVQVRVEHDATR